MCMRQRTDLQALRECILAEIILDRNELLPVVLRRSPSQNINEFSDLLDHFETMVTKIKDIRPHC